jgi:hypothetical protein
MNDIPPSTKEERYVAVACGGDLNMLGFEHAISRRRGVEIMFSSPFPFLIVC